MKTLPSKHILAIIIRFTGTKSKSSKDYEQIRIPCDIKVPRGRRYGHVYLEIGQ